MNQAPSLKFSRTERGDLQGSRAFSQCRRSLSASPGAVRSIKRPSSAISASRPTKDVTCAGRFPLVSGAEAGCATDSAEHVSRESNDFTQARVERRPRRVEPLDGPDVVLERVGRLHVLDPHGKNWLLAIRAQFDFAQHGPRLVRIAREEEHFDAALSDRLNDLRAVREARRARRAALSSSVFPLPRACRRGAGDGAILECVRNESIVRHRAVVTAPAAVFPAIRRR